MPDLIFIFVFLAVWVFMSYLVRQVFSGERGLVLAGICMAALSSFLFSSFVVGSLRSVGQLPQMIMYHFFTAGMIAAVCFFISFYVYRAAKIGLWKINMWRFRSRVKTARECQKKAEELLELAEKFLEKSDQHSEKAERLLNKIQGTEGPEPQEGEQKKTGIAKRRLKRRIAQRERNGYIEWVNED